MEDQMDKNEKQIFSFIWIYTDCAKEQYLKDTGVDQP